MWIRHDTVLGIHRRQLAEHGGSESVRDKGLLDSALNRTKNLLAYSDEPPDLTASAAAYAMGLVKNHPSVDGNKRTAYVVCRLFLILNGNDIQASKEAKYLTFLGAADGSLSANELAEWIHEYSYVIKE